MEPSQKNGLFIDPVFDGPQVWIWTSDKETASRAWYVVFLYGRCGLVDIDYDAFYVRAVR